MSLDLLDFGGYGHFVWPAFLFTFVSCVSLYLMTKKELKKYEEIFLIKFKQLPVTKIDVVKHKRTPREVVAGSYSI